MLFDTVAAVSTPRGKGGIAVIRISGEGVRDILARVFRPFAKQEEIRPRYAVYGEILDTDGSVLDEGLVTFFESPRSFTGEDVAELSCHGGALLTERVLCAVLAAGAREAERGEFTRRAVMNGKIKLSEAESLGALLEARTDAQIALASGGMKGKLSRALEEEFGALSRLMADAYAKIDFPDEDLNSMSVDELAAAFAERGRSLRALSQSYRAGHAVAEGIRTVICGPVNAGKSTLYNALVGHEAAIVTNVAGTTRDVLCETAALGDVTLRLYDTAGLRETEDAVEEIGVSRARSLMRDAELILCVLDAASEPNGEVRSLLEELRASAAPVIVVLNQCDRGDVFPAELLRGFCYVVRLSAATGDVTALADTVRGLFLADGIDLREDPIVTTPRQHAALARAIEAIERSVAALTDGVPMDAALIDVELAMTALGEVDGRAVDEAILADIFANFCVGK